MTFRHINSSIAYPCLTGEVAVRIIGGLWKQGLFVLGSWFPRS